MGDRVEHQDRWFQGRLSSPDSKLYVLEGDDFSHRIVAKFERAADAAAVVAAHNAAVQREAVLNCGCAACRAKQHRADDMARYLSKKAVA